MELINIDNKGTTVVYFWAPWCGTCRMFENAFEDISKNIKNIKFYKLNVDNNKNIAKEYVVMSIPTIIIFKDGKEIKRHIGPLNEEKFKNLISK